MLEKYAHWTVSNIWPIPPKFWMINSKELIVYVNGNNLLLTCMTFMVSKAPYEWKHWPCEQKKSKLSIFCFNNQPIRIMANDRLIDYID